jgi:DNA-directed RNA polymerase
LFIARQFRQDLETELAVKVGEWGVQMLLTLPIFKFEGGLLTLPMTDDLIDFLAEVIMRGAAEHPYLFPSGTPPRPWTGVRAGCLPPDDWARPPLIRSRYPVIEDVARKRIGTGQMQPMLDAVHALQSTAFMINESVLHFMWGDDSPDRPRPDPNTSEKEQREAATELQEWEMAKLTALLLAAIKRFFIYLNVDFRGRLNPLPHFHYMRDDLVRGLFLFADEARIGEEGLQYLKAHVARAADGNKWSGVEKPSKLNFEQRIAWTENNLETLRNFGDAVLRGDDRATWAWALPKKPCQFVAACVELKQALDTGPDFKTRLPLNFDGSCSGLQHLCAMMRAEEGRYANLTANVEADDFYLRVAGQVYDKYPDLRYLMEGRDDRDIVKRPSMTYFYASLPGGFTFTDEGGHLAIFGMMAQVVEVLEDRQILPKDTLKRARERQKLRKRQKLERRQKLNAKDWQILKKVLKDARRLAQAVYDTIEAMVPAAKAVREFLQKIVKLYANREEAAALDDAARIMRHQHLPEILDQKYTDVALSEAG